MTSHKKNFIKLTKITLIIDQTSFIYQKLHMLQYSKTDQVKIIIIPGRYAMETVARSHKSE